MKSIPREFHFMNQTWTIRPANYKEIDTDMGQCDPNTLTILIDPTLPPDLIQQTIWHEIVHAWEQTLQLDLPERTVDLLALSLVHFFKTNNEFAAIFLQEQDHDREKEMWQA